MAGYDDCYSTWISAAKTISKDIITKKSYGRGVGTPDTKIVAKSTYGRGVGTPDTKINAKKTIPRGVGTIPEIKIDPKGAAQGRGVGTPAITIRAKSRIIPYSSKQNALRMNTMNSKQAADAAPEVQEGYLINEKLMDEKLIGIF